MYILNKRDSFNIFKQCEWGLIWGSEHMLIVTSMYKVRYALVDLYLFEIECGFYNSLPQKIKITFLKLVILR